MGKGERGQGQEATQGGLKGLKALGVRELNYKLAFLACNVSATNPRVSLGISKFFDWINLQEKDNALRKAVEKDRMIGTVSQKTVEQNRQMRPLVIVGIN